MQSRYGETMTTGEMTLALKDLKRKDGESLHAFHDRVKKLSKKAPLEFGHLAAAQRENKYKCLECPAASANATSADLQTVR